jgi:hypothetical protein
MCSKAAAPTQARRTIPAGSMPACQGWGTCRVIVGHQQQEGVALMQGNMNIIV